MKFCRVMILSRSPGRGSLASHRWQGGAVLLEVILALILFVAAAAILTGGMNASIQTLDRTRLNMHASNLAVSIMSELQMGLRPATVTGEEPFDAPFEEWTWELVVTDLAFQDADMGATGGASMAGDLEEDAGPLSFVKVEVVIRHGFESIVHRLVQVVPVIPTVEPVETEEETGENYRGNLETDLEAL